MGYFGAFRCLLQSFSKTSKREKCRAANHYSQLLSPHKDQSVHGTSFASMTRKPWPLAFLPLAHLGLVYPHPPAAPRYLARRALAVPAAPSLLGKPVVLDRLCRGWRVHQVKNGYRFNGDDLLLAREAWRAKRESKRLLDLGAGGLFLNLS